MEQTAEEAIQKLLTTNNSLMRGDSDTFNYGRIAFGIPVLDKLTGGGIPKKRMTIIYGPSNVGKSYLASQVIVKAQQQGEITAWIDTELSWDAVWMDKCGIDTSKILVAQPVNGEEAMNTIRGLMQEGVNVIVLDSIAGLVPTAVHNEDFSYNPMAWQARFVNSSLPKLLPNLKFGSAFVAINQVRSSIGPVALDNMPGGLAQTFFAHFLLQVRRKGWIEDTEKTKVGFDMEVRLRKSKVGGESWQSAIVPFRVEGGIDIIESYIREGIRKKIIKQAGPWYSFNETKVMGLNGIKKIFSENPDQFAVLRVGVEE